MKLQDKKQISSDFNLQRKMQVDEGVIIAKKVDVLRETLVSLEAQKAKFLAGSRQELINATKELQEQKKIEEEKLNKIKEEWKEVEAKIIKKESVSNEEKENFAIKLADLTIKELELNERESEIKKTEKTIGKTQQESAELKADAERDREQTLQEKNRARIVRQEAENNRDAQNRELAEKAKISTNREKELDGLAKVMELRKQNLEMREQGLINKEKAINDKYETLIRTIERIKKENGKPKRK